MALRRFSSSCCRWFLRHPSSPSATLSALLQAGWIGWRVGAKRHLLSEDVVRLEEFQRRKLAVAHLNAGTDGNFIDLFGRKLRRNSLVLRDELKLLLHLCQSAEDMKTARDAIYRYGAFRVLSHGAAREVTTSPPFPRYHAENRNVAHGEFKFGPVFMRLCYELGLEKMAAATLTDKEMRGFFGDPTSFNIAIDMLFVKGCHEDALEVLRSMRSQNVAFNKDTLMLASAVCYKLNSTESHAICTSLIEEAQVKGHFVSRHAYCFAVALALKQNDIEKAQLLFSQILITDSRLCQNLKVLLLATSGAVQEAVMILFSAAKLSKGPSFVRKPEFSQEVLDQLRARAEGGERAAGTERVLSQLERAGRVTPLTLDDMLCRTPAPKRKAAAMAEQRPSGRRTPKPLRSALLSE
ncbi:pentatricopeptide repeat-containing protein 2, mitochondrial isoform X1 [Syngnathoides biaculeatus]|uniref:pentatricopeptide repeat-containing protein 2, mitochondrial isoform X1 n=1 Tax=Syngnathoides biaculeatus TaxID=300417 RepID=UPI002ADDD957|nr:pentatricopeptide repeat-containing protein 2, mitochondrial isoform X1 [Syngnathoides biaculeatus]